MEKLTVITIIDLYKRHCAIESVHSAVAHANRMRTFEWFCAFNGYGEMLVRDMKPYHLTDFIEAKPSWKSVSTRRANSNFIRAAFQWAANQERIDRNPFKRVRYAEAERRPDMPDEILERLCLAASKPFERFLRFLRLTGCRIGEANQALWPDMDLDRGVWVIPQHKTRKITGKAKVVALIPQAVELLKPHFQEGGPVFLNCEGLPWTDDALRMYLKRLKRRLGITHPATCHGIRHAMASAAIAAGAPMKLVAAQLGHQNLATTEKYYCHLEGQIDAIRNAAQMGAPKKLIA